MYKKVRDTINSHKPKVEFGDIIGSYLGNAKSIGNIAKAAWQKITKSDKKAIDELVKMVQQGDLDLSDLFMYYETAGKKDGWIVMQAIEKLGYKPNGNISEQVGTSRKNYRNRRRQYEDKS